MKYLKCHMKTDSWDNCHPPQWVYVWYLWYMCYFWKLVHEDKTLEVSCEKRVCSHPIVSCGLTVTHLRHQTLIQSYEGISNCSGMIDSHLELIHLIRKTVQKLLTTKNFLCNQTAVLWSIICHFCYWDVLVCFEDMTRVTHLHPWACHRLRSLVFVLPSLSLPWLFPPWSHLITSPTLPCFRWEPPFVPFLPLAPPPPADLRLTSFYWSKTMFCANDRENSNFHFTFLGLTPGWYNVWLVGWFGLLAVVPVQWWQRYWLKQAQGR